MDQEMETPLDELEAEDAQDDEQLGDAALGSRNFGRAYGGAIVCIRATCALST